MLSASTSAQKPAPSSSQTGGLGSATPMMAQYFEIKSVNPGTLLFYRMGDFYELFFEDAEIASRALGIMLTKRGKHLDQPVPMCGVPVERAEDYLQRLIQLGHRVAICEQLEDPSEARKRGYKALVRRDVVRIITPGTLTEEALLDPSQPNYLCALVHFPEKHTSSFKEPSYGLALADISTGSFFTLTVPEHKLSAEIARFEPKEIILSEHLARQKSSFLKNFSIPLTQLAYDLASEDSYIKCLCDFFEIQAVESFGALTSLEYGAAASLIAYLKRTQLAQKPHLSFPICATESHALEIDAATRANLELTRTLSGTRKGSLLDILDRTCSPAGARLLAERLATPLRDLQSIAQRLDSVEFFVQQANVRQRVQRLLKNVPDIMRILSRLSIGRSHPRDLGMLREGLRAIEDIKALWPNSSSLLSLPFEIAEALQAFEALPKALYTQLQHFLIDPNAPPDEAMPGTSQIAFSQDKRKGGYIRKGVDSILDEKRLLQSDSRQAILAKQADYAERLDIRQVKIKHTHQLGFFLEVPLQYSDKLREPPWNQEFIHRYTMADALRFTTEALSNLGQEIDNAREDCLNIEIHLFDTLAAETLTSAPSLQKAAQALSALDVAAALAQVAQDQEWTRPEMCSLPVFHVKKGRHPVVEKSLREQGQPYVPNSCRLSFGDFPMKKASDKEERDPVVPTPALALITGPNMAGKSTYLRQNALIVILAQMGSFVPAEEAQIGLVDRLFSRVGAADDLARGHSTFMVEMVETAGILNQATQQSFIILDEIGRGTATFDGLAIAWAVLEYIHEKLQARTLFATHFHELTRLSQQLPRLSNLTMRVTEWENDVVFLHEIISGTADRSYGIHVAKRAGLPPEIIRRAEILLEELEREKNTSAEKVKEQMSIVAPTLPEPLRPLADPYTRKKEKLFIALTALNPDNLAPRQALEVLYELKKGIE